MKRFIIVFLCSTALVLCGISAHSQTAYQIYKIRSGPKNFYTGEYTTVEKTANIGMVFDNSVIRIYDEARSIYIARNYKEIRNDAWGTIGKWDGIDEKGRGVGIYMANRLSTNETSLTIAYNDFIFEYFFYE